MSAIVFTVGRSTVGVCSLRPVNLALRNYQPMSWLHHVSIRQLYSGGVRGGGQGWRRLLSSEAKSTVRAIPVQAAPSRTRLSGMLIV